jgi:hypothetical protein
LNYRSRGNALLTGDYTEDLLGGDHEAQATVGDQEMEEELTTERTWVKSGVTATSEPPQRPLWSPPRPQPALAPLPVSALASSDPRSLARVRIWQRRERREDGDGEDDTRDLG